MSGYENVLVAVWRKPQSRAVIQPATPLEADVHPRTAPLAPITTGVFETVIGPPPARVVVATPNTPAAPFDTRRLLDAGCDVVARPTQLIVSDVLSIGRPNVSGASYVPKSVI